MISRASFTSSRTISSAGLTSRTRPTPLTRQQTHRFDVTGCVDVWRESHEVLERHLLAGDHGVTDHRFVRARFLTARFLSQPFLDKSRPQRAMRSIRPAETKQCRTDRVVFVSSEQFLFIIGMRARFPASEETRSYDGSLRA